MEKLKLIPFFLLILSLFSSCKTDETPITGYTTPKNYAGMTLIWADEFSGGTLNSENWKYEIGDGCPNVCGWGNNELEYYRKENAFLKNGLLVIEAKEEITDNRNYTSSRIITKDKFSFRYGRVDVRAILPEGQGIWPAIWMLGDNIDEVSWPACGEIDIMEKIGGDNRENKIYATAHWDHEGNHAMYGGDYTLSKGTFGDKFHVFSIVWDATKITWYVDDVNYHQINITPDGVSELRNSYFLLLNVAVGGDWPGTPTASTVFPQRMSVDYVRVFQDQ